MDKIDFWLDSKEKSISEILNKKIKADLFLRKQPGVYFLIKEDEVVYVGQSEDVPVRIRSHKHGGLIEFDHVYYLHVNPENLVEVEKYYIRLLKPKRNRRSISQLFTKKQKNVTKIQKSHSKISKNIPPHAMSLYADILDSKLMELDLRKELIHGVKGTYVKQVSDGNNYWYLQTYDSTTKKTSKMYIGPDTQETREQILYLKKKLKEYRDFSAAEQVEQNVSMLRAVRNIPLPTPIEEKFFGILEKYGIFLNGAILVGEQAFRCYPLMLGKSFSVEATKSSDINLVSIHESPNNIKTNIEKDLILYPIPMSVSDRKKLDE